MVAGRLRVSAGSGEREPPEPPKVAQEGSGGHPGEGKGRRQVRQRGKERPARERKGGGRAKKGGARKRREKNRQKEHRSTKRASGILMRNPV